ncbi:glycerol-3-phosphate dehydrogenase [Jonquetella anthropi DSM 22815]|uniref:Glycerol-3-phosphate dehydrogenase [NAD(P)+] n=1 Tax=Jonquetella anthropi DSM 22815 TaxID=885272 RepID=H0ULZ3_9BACT|nr:NAD(P)H-dependent glycerol-3-phosphate dehydrogenase [Jonquetella anthropi]EHM12535.1 glycerol-3-phosphate dehydrogenase [Jonquetella anthropi DSM 22815]
MNAPVTVFGAGSWGTALAQILSANGPVTLWCRDSEQASYIAQRHANPKRLKDQPLNPSIEATSSLPRAAGSPLWVLAVPLQSLRGLLTDLAPHWRPGVMLCNAAKGVEIGSLKLPSGIAEELLPAVPFAVISGPSHAEEAIQGLPACVVAAARSERDACLWQKTFGTPSFRVYSSTDLIGVEIGGAVKNVIAVASGMIHRYGMGDNAAAATVCRGLAEITRLGLAMGAKPLTFSGLAGVGDLMVTAFSRHSRNFRLGELIGGGLSLQEAAAQIGEVAEGAWTVRALANLSRRLGVEMPISDAVYQILYQGQDPLNALQTLLTRPLRPEAAGITGD